MLSGRWTLDQEGQEVASGQKSSVFSRTFEIQDQQNSFVLRAEFPLGRSFRLEGASDETATIKPDHPFTRRATIEPVSDGWEFRYDLLFVLDCRTDLAPCRRGGGACGALIAYTVGP